MSDLPQTAPSSSHDEQPAAQSPAEQEPAEQDLLVEEVSIDGMCGVY